MRNIMNDSATELSTFEVEHAKGATVSALTLRPAGADAALVLGHGAGAGMRHTFMQTYAQELAERGVATFRYQFPYMEAGRKYPDRRPALIATVHAAIGAARKTLGELPLFAGGKSMGGRMTSLLAAGTDEAPEDWAESVSHLRGLVFVGFPLHPPKKPGTERAAHLPAIDRPMLFLQGTRDTLAGLELLEPITRELSTTATLHIVDGGDHSFHVLKRSGRTNAGAMTEIADATRSWMGARLP